MKTLKNKTLFVLLIAVILGMGFLTSCDEILEAFYPELTEMNEGEIIVYVNFDSNIYGINEFVNGSRNIKVAAIPFLETYNGFNMQVDDAIIQEFYIGDFQNRFLETRFYVPENKIYKVIAWVDRNNDYEPNWDDSAYPEPSRMATDTWTGNWWMDYRWGFYSVETDVYLSLGDEIAIEQLEGNPDDIGGDGGFGEPPIASPQADFTSVGVGNSINFWSDSWDPDGFIINREWQIQGPYGGQEYFSQPTLTYWFNDIGEYTVSLKVWDNDGNESGYSAPIRINVYDTGSYTNQAPNSDFWSDRTNVALGQEVRFESNSWDPDGGIVDYYWNFNDGNEYYGGDVEWHSFTNSGSYNVSLTVTDNSGATDTSDLWVYVAASGAVNREISITGTVSGINSYSSPIMIKLISLSNDPGMEIDSRVIYGATNFNETFDYLPEDEYGIIAWWDANNNYNPDPGEPGAFADGTDSSGDMYLSMYDINVPSFSLWSSVDYTLNATFNFTSTDGEFLFSTPTGSDGTVNNALGLGINTTHYGAFVGQGAYSYYYLDNLGSYPSNSLQIMLQNVSNDIDLYVYGATSSGNDYENAVDLITIGSSTAGGTAWETVNVPADHGYNSIFILAYGYAEGSYDVNIISF
ncbi:MAG: PKD domain-containing protein [Spirochaetales bacterium]|nr:PKD domain-containing protein [Spirochaetales bacterium]